MTNEELWEKKTYLAKLLNKSDYKGAINYMTENIDNLDWQFCEMFICGLNINFVKELPNKLIQKIDSVAVGLMSYRESFRWEIMKSMIEVNLE